LNYIIKFLKAKYKNILFLFFIIAFSIFIFNNRKNLYDLLDFNFLNLSFLFVFFIITNLIKTKLNQYLYSIKNIDMSFLETLNLIIKSTAGNLATPFSLGTGYKFHYLKKKYNLSYSQNLNINLYFTIFTNIVYVFVMIVISILVYIQGNSIYLNLIIFWSSVFFVGVILFYLLSKEYKFNKLKFLNSYSMQSSDLPLNGVINLIIFTSLLLFVNILSHIYLFRLLDLNINTFQIVSYVCISGLANLVKFTPGNFGINESVLIISNLHHGLAPLEVILVSLIFRFFSWVNILFFYAILNIQKPYNKRAPK